MSRSERTGFIAPACFAGGLLKGIPALQGREEVNFLRQLPRDLDRLMITRLAPTRYVVNLRRAAFHGRH